MVIYAIESKATIINKKLAELSFGHTSHIKYISFKNTNSQTRIGCLHTNNCQNINSKFKILYNTNVNKILPTLDNKWMLMKDHLLDVKDKNNQPLFLGTEQGTGKHEANVFIVYSPRKYTQVHKWLHEEYPKLIKDGITLVPSPKNMNCNEYNKSIQEFITPVISTKSTLKLNKFGSKYKSYTSALCNNTPKE